jgi:hypothetical protein
MKNKKDKMSLFDYLNSEELPLALVMAIGLYNMPDMEPIHVETSEEADMVLEIEGY